MKKVLFIDRDGTLAPTLELAGTAADADAAD